MGEDRASITRGQLAVFGSGDTLVARAAANRSLDLLLLGGKPIREPIATYGPFVMNTRAELAAAVAAVGRRADGRRSPVSGPACGLRRRGGCSAR